MNILRPSFMDVFGGPGDFFLTNYVTTPLQKGFAASCLDTVSVCRGDVWTPHDVAFSSLVSLCHSTSPFLPLLFPPLSFPTFLPPPSHPSFIPLPSHLPSLFPSLQIYARDVSLDGEGFLSYNFLQLESKPNDVSVVPVGPQTTISFTFLPLESSGVVLAGLDGVSPSGDQVVT